MSLTPGTRLGPYELASLIGSGGMGEVYKARDTRLDRTVAIKVLPEALAADPQFRERFDREARTISSLNHPHICILHDVGHQDGTDYLVMEYLEGETLADRLKKGALPLDPAFRYAIEMADALDTAHRAGITHRDLKPGNIMLTKSGSKLLDFGLAKTGATPASALAGVSAAPTREGLTAQGAILGTFQYMAPEQLEGKDADARTDIFAFGAVVYEMLTGKKAFEGKSHASLIGAILKDTPPPISTIQPLTPPALDRVVKKCLAKEPDERWQSANDLRDEVKWIVEGAPAPTAITVTRGARSRERFAWIATALAVAVAGALAVPYLRTPAAAPEMRLEITTPSTSSPVSFAISPDGRRLVFAASGEGQPRLWLRPLDMATAQPLSGTEGAIYPFWSPDSRSIGFFAEGKLKRLDVGGGLPQVLADASPRGGSWNADGVIVFTRTGLGPLFRVPGSGGEAVAVTRLSAGQGSHRFPHFLPGGRQFLFYAQGTVESHGIYLGSLDSPEAKRVMASDTAGAYAPNGWLLFVRAGTLLAQRFDLARGELTGDPITVADPVGTESGVNIGALSVSAAGLVAYRSGGSNRRQLAWFDRSGKLLGAMGPPDESLSGPSLSPDGRRVAAHRTVQSNADIWLLDATRTTRFTFDTGLDRFPVWSPDGSRIVFDSNRKGHRDLYQRPTSGAASEQLLIESPQDKFLPEWSPDGRFIIYASNDPKTAWDIWILPLQGDRKAFAFLKTSFNESSGVFSPDGRWVAYASNESGRY